MKKTQMEKMEDMKKIEDMENRNNHKNQKTVKTVKTDKTAGAIFSESLKSLKSIMPFFANNEKKGSRVKAHIAAMVAILLIIGVGDVWGETITADFQCNCSQAGISSNTFTASNGEASSSYYHLKTGSIISDKSYDIDPSKSVSVTMNLGTYGGFNSGQNDVTFYLVNSDGTQISTSYTSNFTKKYTGNEGTPFTGSVTLNTGQTGKGVKFKFVASGTATSTIYARFHTLSITYTALVTKCATPTFSPAAGTYNNNQSVSINCATASATIRYTTNGSDPTESSATYSSPISVSGPTTIKAKAFKAGLTASDIATSTYTMVCATPTFSVAEGTYNNDQSVALSCETEGAVIHYTTDGTNPTSSSPTYSSALSISSTQTLKAIAIKSGYTNSSITSATYTMVCVDPTITLAGGTYYNDQSTTISTTTAGATIRYTLDETDPTESSAVYSSAIAITSSKTLKAKVFKSGYTASSVASANYTMTCATPTYSKNSFTSTGPTSITLNTTTEGATIYYTTDGSTPTSSSIEYTGAIQINATKTIKVIAIKDDYNNSSVPTQKTYTIKCATPTATPAAGTYTGSADITLSTTYGDAIYYTTSTTSSAAPTPTTESTLYTGPIHITTTTKIKAIATKEGCENSTILGGSSTYLYTIQYNVTWMVDGEEWTPSSSGGTDGQALVNSGTHISTLPTAPTTGEFCGDRFMGWTDAEGGAYVHGSSGLYTTASGFPNATGDQVFYAVFADYAE